MVKVYKFVLKIVDDGRRRGKEDLQYFYIVDF
jgi:hypothetical protein